MSLLVDFISIASIVGIWPRYIEPKMLTTSELTWTLKTNQCHLSDLTIVQLSDLHFHRKLSQTFLDKITHRVLRLNPDLLVFTGDFLCYSKLEESQRLKRFLQQFHAPLGCYCIFGNHDYSEYVSRNQEGIYDIIPPPNPVTGVIRGLKTIFSSPRATHGVSDSVLTIKPHSELCALLTDTPFQVLENTTITLPAGLNITGLGDLALGRCLPEHAFENYDPELPGIILSHNPDSFPKLLKYPGDWILSGHTHGEQIHFPWPKWLNRISQKLAQLENPGYTRGLFSLENKKFYVNRGLGCHKPFRLCSVPEITVLRTQLCT